jgi:hypothetical protein
MITTEEAIRLINEIGEEIHALEAEILARHAAQQTAGDSTND